MMSPWRSSARPVLLGVVALLGSLDATPAAAANACAQATQTVQGPRDTGAEVIGKINSARADNATDIVAGTLVGALVSTVTAQAEAGGVARAIAVNGVSAVASGANDGLFVVVVDRATHAVSSQVGGLPANIDYGGSPTDIGSLTSLLNTLGGDVVVALASKGNITAMAQDAGLAAAMARVGASSAFAALASGQAYVLIGIPGLGAGKGIEMVTAASSAPAAVATVMIDDVALYLMKPLAP